MNAPKQVEIAGFVEFGALARPLRKQLRGVPVTAADQANADAITRLSVYGLLTDQEARKARLRLVKSLEARDPGKPQP